MKRIAVLLSGLWIAGWFLVFWKDSGRTEYLNHFEFVFHGVVPVGILWGLGWVVSDFRQDAERRAK